MAYGLSGRMLLAAGANGQKNLPSDEDETSEASTRLVEAVQAGDAKAVASALSQGANPSMVVADFSDPTVLHLAVMHGHLRIVKLLLNRGADVEATDRFGLTPLHYAAAAAADVTQVLIDAGANPDQTDIEGNAPIHYAATNGLVEVLKVLVKGGAGINALDRGGDAALHQAAENGHIEAVKVLLELGADASIEDEGGQTALEEICEDVDHCTPEVIDTLTAILSAGK